MGQPGEEVAGMAERLTWLTFVTYFFHERPRVFVRGKCRPRPRPACRSLVLRGVRSRHFGGYVALDSVAPSREVSLWSSVLTRQYGGSFCLARELDVGSNRGSFRGRRDRV